MKRNAKIVATLGPSSNNEAIITKLIEAGLDVARLNFSHGTHDEHAARIRLVRNISDRLMKPVTILQDLQGPKLRVGNLPKEGVTLTAGQVVSICPILDNMDGKSDSEGHLILPLDVPDLINSVDKGNRILLDDGKLEMEVIEKHGDCFYAKVVLGGQLTSHKGVNLPGSNISIPCLTEKDLADLEFGIQMNVDTIAISFVRCGKDVETVKETIARINPQKADLPVIAKLERPEAIENLYEILDIADGVMVARGDLGVETSPTQIPIMQKQIIRAANERRKIVITATQMLESMIQNPRPTRAESTDVANAIFDGTDAVMLSGETASGKYPVEAVQMMASIVTEAENHFEEWGHCDSCKDQETTDDAIAITRAAKDLAQDRNVSAIAVFTVTGKTALLMSKTRPRVPILAFTPNEEVYHRLGTMWGVTPFLVPLADSVEEMLTHVEVAMVSSTPLEPGEQVVVISGFPVGNFRAPNFALLYTLGKR